MKYRLTKAEEIQRKVLACCGLCLPLIIFAGSATSSAHLDKNYIIQPVLLFLLLFFTIIFCCIYSFNAFTTKNIVRNWAHPRIFTFVLDLFNSSKITYEKAERITVFIFGFFTLAIAIGCLILCIYFSCTKWPV